MIRAASLAALSLFAALVVACGSGAASGDADPASAVPGNAMLYAEVAVRPEGQLRDDALDATGKVLHTDDPEGKLRELLDKALAEQEDADLDYDRDIKPWLGERAALWLSTRTDSEGDPSGAAVVAVTDSDAAMQSIRKGATSDGEKLTDRSYKDVDYVVDSDKVAAGVAEDYLLIGPEPEVKASIDAVKGDSLAENDRFKDSVDELDDERLASFYMDLKPLIQLAQREQPNDQDLQQLQQLVPLDKFPPIVGSFAANGDRLALDFAVHGKDLKDLGPLAQGYASGSTPLLQELPGDTWAAFGSAKYGQTLKATFDQYAGMFGGAAAKQQIQSQFGINLDEDVLSWIGDVAAYVRGDSLDTLDGAVVIQVTDSDKAAKGFGKLVGLLQSAGGVRAKPVQVEGAEAAFSVSAPDVPKPIVLARSSERVVIAYGAAAAKETLSPSSTFGDSETYKAAKDKLGLDPALVVSMPSIIKLVDASGEADAEFEQARPYLEAYDVIAYGFKGGDDGGLVRMVAGLK
jgi:Protein of unknown function (DUF3352)